MLLILPINVFAVYEVVDSRCTTDIKTTLRKTAENFTYRLERIKKDNGVLYNIELLNVDKTMYIANSFDGVKYYNGTIKNVKSGTMIRLYIYASNETYCEGYKINTISIQIPYYNKYSENSMCIGYEKYALCNPTSNINITEKEFETQMKIYIASINQGNNNIDEEPVDTKTKESFDLVAFVTENADYISGIGWILLVTYLGFVIGRLNKKRGIL